MTQYGRYYGGTATTTTGASFSFVRATSVQNDPPTAAELQAANGGLAPTLADGDRANIRLSDGTREVWSRISGAWVRTDVLTPTVERYRYMTGLPTTNDLLDGEQALVTIGTYASMVFERVGAVIRYRHQATIPQVRTLYTRAQIDAIATALSTFQPGAVPSGDVAPASVPPAVYWYCLIEDYTEPHGVERAGMYTISAAGVEDGPYLSGGGGGTISTSADTRTTVIDTTAGDQSTTFDGVEGEQRVYRNAGPNALTINAPPGVSFVGGGSAIISTGVNDTVVLTLSGSTIEILTARATATNTIVHPDSPGATLPTYSNFVGEQFIRTATAPGLYVSLDLVGNWKGPV